MKQARELFSATELYSPRRPVFYGSLHPIFEKLLDFKERTAISMATTTTTTTNAAVSTMATTAIAANAAPYAAASHGNDDYHHGDGEYVQDHEASSCLLGPPRTKKFKPAPRLFRDIRDKFSVPEEAFILMVIRKHLVHRFGQRVFACVWPSGVPGHPAQYGDLEEAIRDDDDNAVAPAIVVPPFEFAPESQRQGLGMALRHNPRPLPHWMMMQDDDEVAATNVFEVRDARYYRAMAQELEMKGSLKEESVLASVFDSFSFPPPFAFGVGAAAPGGSRGEAYEVAPASPCRRHTHPRVGGGSGGLVSSSPPSSSPKGDPRNGRKRSASMGLAAALMQGDPTHVLASLYM